MVEDFGVGGEDPVRQPVLAHELPDILDRVQLGRLGGKRHEGDVVRDHEPLRLMPPGLVEQDDGVSAGGNSLRDLGEMQAHALARAAGQHQASAFAMSRADRPEDVGRLRSLVFGRCGPRAPPGPTPRDLVLLSDASLIGEPDLYRLAAGLVRRNRVQTGRECFLKEDTAASLLAWWRGRAESFR